MKTELYWNTKEGRLADQSRERQAAFKKKKKHAKEIEVKI